MESELRIAGHQVAVLRERHPPLGGGGLHTGRRLYLCRVNEKFLVKIFTRRCTTRSKGSALFSTVGTLIETILCRRVNPYVRRAQIGSSSRNRHVPLAKRRFLPPMFGRTV